MENKIKRKKNANSDTRKLIKTEVLLFAIYLFGFIISSLVALIYDLSADLCFPVCLAVLGICSFTGGFIVGIKKRKNGLVNGIVFLIPINSLIILISLFLCSFNPDLNIIISFSALILASAAGGICGVNSKVKR